MKVLAHLILFSLLGLQLGVGHRLYAQDEPAEIPTEVVEEAAETNEEQADAQGKPPGPESEADSEPVAYEFTLQKSLDTTDVKSQGNTGTCWSFASTSFIESELIRQGKGEHDLSEMFVVKNTYLDKAHNFLRRQGKTNFGQGALAHDFIRAASDHGLVPESVYDGLDPGVEKHDHAEMFSVLNGMLDGLLKRRRLSDRWPTAFESVTATYLGEAPLEFSYEGESYSPKSFAKHLEFDGDDYVNITSFSHRPFGKPFVLEIPDNFSSGLFENVAIDDLVATIDHAIENGYTVAWDGDVSEQGFSKSKGLAVLPVKDRKDYLESPGEELEVDQAMRQETFEEHSTTDDHLMHLTGIAHDQNGNKYYLIKNSWGEVGDHDGYLYMSEAYVRLKTIAILVHKDAFQRTDKSDTAEESTETASPKT